MSGCTHLYGCVHVPDFAVQAALRVESGISFEQDSVAILDGPDSLQKVFACNAPARQAGIVSGMTKIQAEALPGIKLRKRMIEQEQAAHSALMDCGYSFSPRLESTCPGTIILDLSGAERLLGTQTQIAWQLANRAAECGLEAHVALAANPDTALHAARGFARVTLIRAGEEKSRLACLPIEVLQPEAEILDTLDSWGIRDFKSLAALPAIALTQRLGQHGLHLQQIARGEVQRELIPAEPVARFQESLELEEPLELLEPLAFGLNRLLERLIKRLMMRSLATDQAQVDLELELHADRQLQSHPPTAAVAPLHQRTLKLPVSTQDVKVLLKLLQLDLAAHPPQAPVKKLTVELFPAQIRFEKAGLFQPHAPEPAKLEVTMARLRAVVGEKDERGRDRVGFAAVQDSYKPDSFAVLPFRPETKRKQGHEHRRGPTMAFRVFRPPLQAKVELTANVPSAVLFQGTRKKVVNASGPWRKSGAWWDKAGEWKRDEWDVELSVPGGKGLYRIFHDDQSGQWFVEGMYD
jgi:protein ImuB